MLLSGGCTRYGKKVDIPCAVDAASKCFHEMEKCVIDDSEENDHVDISKNGQ